MPPDKKGPKLDIVYETRDTTRTIRQAHDWYRTPAWCVLGLYDAFPDLSYPTLDPCAGDGALIVAARQRFGHLPRLRGVERVPEIAEQSDPDVRISIGDGLAESWRGEHILMNPPFKTAEDFVAKAVDEADSAAILLRLGFLSAQRRYKLWTQLPKPWGLAIMSRRPRFTSNGGGDRYDYVWAVWRRSMSLSLFGDTRLRWIV